MKNKTFTNLQRKQMEKHALEIETIREQFYEENRILRADLARRTQANEAQSKQIEALKAVVVDQQLNITVLLTAIRNGVKAEQADGVTT